MHRRSRRPWISQLALAGLLGLPGIAAATAVPVAAQASRNATQRPFNEQDYDLAWDAFLAAGNLNDAIALAQKALLAQPNSVLWHQRLATVAEQNSDAALAARAYGWLASQGGQPQYLEHAIDLSVGTQQDELAIQLLQARAEMGPFERDRWQSLIDALLNIARFDDAQAAITRANRVHPRRYFLRQLAEIDSLLSKPDAQAAQLQRIIATYGPDPQDNLQLATLEYVGGDEEKALHTLEQARSKATLDDTLYWQTLSSLAWLLQDRTATQQAAKVLVQTNKAAPTDYYRLYFLSLDKDPAVAYGYAFAGWQRTRSDTLFFSALDAIDRLHAPALDAVVFGSVLPGDLNVLEQRPGYWTQWAELAYHQGNIELAKARYLQALRLSSGASGAVAGYIYLLIDSGDTSALSLMVDRFAEAPPTDMPLRSAVASALSALDRPSEALMLLSPYAWTQSGNTDLSIEVADLLDQADRPDTADALRRRAIRNLTDINQAVDAANAPTEVVDEKFAQVLALQSRLTPGDPVRNALAKQGPRLLHKELKGQALAWAIAQDNPEATQLWLQRAYANNAAPAWALLAQSLVTDDDTETAHLLETVPNQLPRRDRVTAASKLGWPNQALTLAWQGLEGEPEDRRLEQQFQELVGARSDAVGSGLGWTRISGLQTEQATATAKAWLTPGLSLQADLRQVHQSIYDHTQIASVPGSAHDGTLTLTQPLARGQRGLLLGGGNDIASYTHVGAFYDWQLRKDLSVGVKADYGARLDDDAALSIAGLTDRVSANASYQMTAWDSAGITLDAGRIRAQGGGELGRKQSVTLEYRRALWLAPPSVAFIFSATDARYQRDSVLPDNLRLLLPRGQQVDSSFLIPRSFAQACAGVGVNQDLNPLWTWRLEAFGTASACRNSVSGLGPTIDAGLATPVFGPDHLTLDLGYSNNAGAVGSRTLNATLSYRLFFSP